jgi:phytoene dehydrogenase-like protein
VCGFETAAIERIGERWSVRSTNGHAVGATGAVVSAIPPQAAMLSLLEPPSVVPERIRSRLADAEILVDNVSQLTLSAVLARLPETTIGDEYLASTLWMMPDPEAAMAAYTATRAHRLPERFGTMLTFPTLMDPTLGGPDGRHTMWANSFVAAELDGGWEAARQRCSELVWATIESCLPGTRAHAIAEVLTVPPDLVGYTGALNPGNHVAPTPGQMLRHRPVPGLGWRTPVDGFYLTGAGTPPGGGVNGAAGRVTARCVLVDHRLSRVARRVRASRAVARQLRAGVGAWKQVRDMTSV